MTVIEKRIGLVASVAALIAAGACSGKSAPMDSALRNDLAAVSGSSAGLDLASKSISPNLVISPTEAVPTSTPAPAAKRMVFKPTSAPAPRHVTEAAPAPAPTPAPQTIVTAPVQPQPRAQEPVRASEPAPAPHPDARAAEPPPLPPLARPGSGPDRGGATEGKIFQRMPWIRP